MSTLIIDCPSCSRKLRVPDNMLGRAVKCPTCEHVFDAPAMRSSVSTSAAGMDSSSAASEHMAVPGGTEREQPLDQGENLRSCPKCGERVDQGATRCRLCGEELQQGQDEADHPLDEGQPFPVRRDSEPHRGTFILVLGIVSIVMLCCGLVSLPLGIAAWVMGGRDLAKMRQHLMDREGEALTQAGWVCGIIGTILGALSLLVWLAYIGFIFTMIASTRRMAPPAPVPAPAPIRPPPAPMPGQRDDKAAWHFVPQRWQDYMPRAEA